MLDGWSTIPDDGSDAKQRGRRRACVGKQLLSVLARQANSLHPPRTAEQPHACSMVWSERLQSKEEGGAPVSASSSCECRPGRQTVCFRLAPQSIRTLARWLVGDIPDGPTAKQRGRRQPLSASSSCECRPDRQTVCIHLAPKIVQAPKIAPKSSRNLARLVGDP